MKRTPLDNTKLRVYIDMDHTFCDFNDALNFWKERAKTGIERQWPWSQKGFFSSLLPMEGALEFWNKWENIADLWFLTRPSIPNLHCYIEKAEWVRKYLGEEAQEKLIISPRKDLFHGDILIDDAINCGQQFFEGEHWIFGSDNCPDWNIADLLMKSAVEKKKKQIIDRQTENT
jgi:hypothetical protein